mmetsp:Transcript_32208/g.62997  ORF Transcript_32208/g.62997 Transcript_32208/m.62997 type:complete len:210 (-) Transcript_32208:126-755(-)
MPSACIALSGAGTCESGDGEKKEEAEGRRDETKCKEEGGGGVCNCTALLRVTTMAAAATKGPTVLLLLAAEGNNSAEDKFSVTARILAMSVVVEKKISAAVRPASRPGWSCRTSGWLTSSLRRRATACCIAFPSCSRAFPCPTVSFKASLSRHTAVVISWRWCRRARVLNGKDPNTLACLEGTDLRKYRNSSSLSFLFSRVWPSTALSA